MGSSPSVKKESRRCIRCFSPLELMGIVPGSTTTTIPVTTYRNMIVKVTQEIAKVTQEIAKVTLGVVAYLMFLKQTTGDHWDDV